MKLIALSITYNISREKKKNIYRNSLITIDITWSVISVSDMNWQCCGVSGVQAAEESVGYITDGRVRAALWKRLQEVPPFL